jgi:putative ABC transport system permease protein
MNVRVRWFRLLARAWPTGFVERYGAEMLDSFEEGWRDARRRGRLRAASFLLRTTVNVLGSALAERYARRATNGRIEAEVPFELEIPAKNTSGGTMLRVNDDIRYGLRFLRRHPAFTTVVLLTLALGIGMNTAVFSVLWAALYAPYPYGDANELVYVGRTHPQIAGALLPVSPGNFYALREGRSAIRSLEAETGQSFVYSSGDGATSFAGNAMSPGFFDMLRVPAALGRTFTEADDDPGSPAVVVVSDGFWRAQLGADPGAVGRTIRLDDEPYTVIGVMPAAFQFGGSSLWVPLRLRPGQRSSFGTNYLRMRARLSPGATIAQARAEMEAAWAPLREAHPGGNEDTGMSLSSLRDVYTQSYRSRLMVLAGAALFVLLIACANVANLMLVRAERRQREVGVRAALGAGRGRLAAQFLTEGLVTATLGGLAGIAVGWVGVRALIAVFGSAVPRSTSVAVNLPVLLFSLGIAVVTGVLVGMAPALRRGDDFDVLREGSRGATSRLSRTGRLLVVGEVALAIVLVTGAGLLLKSYARATTSDLGFDARNLVTASFWFPSSRYADSPPIENFLERLDETLRVNPRIEGVAMSSMVPIRDYGNNYTEIGAFGTEAKASFVEARTVTPTFFESLSLSLVAGRTFSDAEAHAHAGTEVVINRTLAKQLFADGDPIGQRLITGGSYQPLVVGVVDDVRDFGPDEAPRPTLYFPTFVGSNLLVRSTLPPSSIAEAIRSAARDIDPAVVLLRMQTMDEILDTSLAGRRFQLTLIAVFAATALVLACVGIYGVLSYLVERQTREIGVRMALGARAAGVAGHVAWRGGQLALVGVLLGGLGSFALRRAIAAQLFEVEAFDPTVFAGVVAVLLAVAALACLVPARRAAVIDPIRALREE